MYYNKIFVELLDELNTLMVRSGEQFKAKAYKNARDSIDVFPDEIHGTEQLLGVEGIGKSILAKLSEFVNTGTIALLERERHNPLNLLTRVYGIGPKNAKELISKGINTIDGLRQHEELLTKNMKLGLQYFEDIEQRIPRSEINEYNTIFQKEVPEECTCEIVGSYRRGQETSGDIDLIISGIDQTLFNKFLDALIAKNIVIEVLSRGNIKSLTIARLRGKPARRVDFLYSPPEEYPFALLYFTGSKGFNTAQRQRAQDKGFTLNEHGFQRNDKSELVKHKFTSEKGIFDFLNMEYKLPCERLDAKCVVIKKNTTKKRKKNTIRHSVSKFKELGISYLNCVNEGELNTIIKMANAQYYEETIPMLTDDEYDTLIEYTKQRFPTNNVANEGHTHVRVKSKLKLPFEMWSMDKIKPDTKELQKWCSQYNGPFVLSCKLDGVSGLYTNIGGPKLYTRGNGVFGQDISLLIPFLNLPQTENIVVRGEFIIKKKVFVEKYSSLFANPRNFVAGIVNSKTPDVEKCEDVDFVIYEVIQPAMLPSAQLDYLTGTNVNLCIVPNIRVGQVSNELLSETLLQWRETAEYEIDGIICMNDKIYKRSKGNPKHAFAFKMVLLDQKAESQVTNVIWTPSKDGYLKPRIQFEPVLLGGVKIEYATGFNGKFIHENSIGIGSTVGIIRSGDVIPYITHVVKPSTVALMPDVSYVWNETNVDIVLIDKNDDDVVKEKNITGFFRGIGVEGLSTGNVKRIIKAGYDTVPKILTMNIHNFLEVEGFKEKLSSKISEDISTKLKNATIYEIMYSTNIFGRGFGLKKLKHIVQEYPSVLLDDIDDASKVDKIKNISGMAEKTAKKFTEHLPTFLIWLKSSNLEYKLNDKNDPFDSQNTNHYLYGKKYVISGFRNKELLAKLDSVGAIQKESVSKDAYMLIVPDKYISTSKTNRANELGVRVVTIDDIVF